MPKFRAAVAALLAASLVLCLPLLATAADTMAQAKAAFDKRADLGQAKLAVELYQKAVAASPGNQEAIAGLGRACAWLGNHLPEDQRAAVFDTAIKAAEPCVEKNPKALACRYWLAVNWSYYGRAKGIMKSLNLVDPIKEQMAAVIEADPAYEQGGPYRTLGRIYFKLPGLFGGSNAKSIANLRKALKYGPTNYLSHLFLAETLMDEGEKAEAKKLLQQVLAGPAPKGMEPEYAEWKAEAAKLMKKLAE